MKKFTRFILLAIALSFICGVKCTTADAMMMISTQTITSAYQTQGQWAERQNDFAGGLLREDGSGLAYNFQLDMGIQLYSVKTGLWRHDNGVAAPLDSLRYSLYTASTQSRLGYIPDTTTESYWETFVNVPFTNQHTAQGPDNVNQYLEAGEYWLVFDQGYDMDIAANSYELWGDEVPSAHAPEPTTIVMFLTGLAGMAGKKYFG